MTINRIADTGLQGIRHGLRGLRRNASEIAARQQTGTSIPSKDAIRSMVELHQNAHQTVASIKAFKTGDSLIGSLLDIKV